MPSSAIELDPRVLDEEIVAAMAEDGITRASFGVQDIEPAVQRRIGRIQTSRRIAPAASAGCARPASGHQPRPDVWPAAARPATHVAATARFAAALGADRVAVFGYAHVPWMKPHQNAIHTEDLPGALERLQQAETAEAGWSPPATRRSASTTSPGLTTRMAIAARDGTLRRNFQGYTTDAAPVAARAWAPPRSAGSRCRFAQGGYAQNEPNERRWVAAVEAGELPIRRGRAVTAEDRLRRHCIERVMCDFAARPRPPCRRRWWPSCGRRSPRWKRDGLLDLTPDLLRVTAAGRRHVRHVAACFDAYLGTGTGRHSAAV